MNIQIRLIIQSRPRNHLKYNHINILWLQIKNIYFLDMPKTYLLHMK